MDIETIRLVWGVYDSSNRFSRRRYTTDHHIKNILSHKIQHEFKTIVMGEKNYAILKKKGVKNLILMQKEPYMFDPQKDVHGNKLACIDYAVKILKPDRLLFLDWDCYPVKQLDDFFWEELESRGFFQANLQRYRSSKCHSWRTKNKHILSNSGFVYVKDMPFVHQVMRNWYDLPVRDNDELAWSKTLDERLGGWIGIDNYSKEYEPTVCELHKKSALPNHEKNVYFRHYHGGPSRIYEDWSNDF